MNREAAFVLAEEIKALVNALREEFGDELRADRRKMETFRAGVSGAPMWEYVGGPRDWDVQLLHVLQKPLPGGRGGFVEILWADVFQTHVGRAPDRISTLVALFIERHSASLKEWEERPLLSM